jgi:hypothetical protein
VTDGNPNEHVGIDTVGVKVSSVHASLPVRIVVGNSTLMMLVSDESI